MRLTRAQLLAGAGALALTPVLGRGEATAATAGPSDDEILALALLLAQVQADLHARIVAVAADGGPVQALARECLGHQRVHVTTLAGLLRSRGAAVAPRPATRIAVDSEASALETAVALEDAGVRALDGAAPLLRDTGLVLAAGGIAQVEARHAAAWRMLAGVPPAPYAFEPPLGPQAAREALAPFLA